MLKKIEEIKLLRKQKAEILLIEERVEKPQLSDFSMIPNIYDWFVAYFSELNCPPNCDSVLQRKKFTFIILYLYAPTTFIGDKMPNGLRESLALALGIKAKSSISDYCENIIFLFSRYRNFRDDVENVYQFILKKLEELQ